MFLKILDFLFPTLCVGCEKEGKILCSKCYSSLTLDVNYEVLSLSLDGLFSICSYEKGGSIAKLLHLYKYEGMQNAGKVLQTLFTSSFKKTDVITFDLLTWVPLTPKKFKKRGFNQAQFFAQFLAPSQKTAQLLCKTRENLQQMTLDKKQRVENVKNVYSLLPNVSGKVVGKTVLIVDDVATTLSTLNECARVLKEAGAKSVIGVVLARQEA